jgi:hypothetical protein
MNADDPGIITDLAPETCYGGYLCLDQLLDVRTEIGAA